MTNKLRDVSDIETSEHVAAGIKAGMDFIYLLDEEEHPNEYYTETHCGGEEFTSRPTFSEVAQRTVLGSQEELEDLAEALADAAEIDEANRGEFVNGVISCAQSLEAIRS